MPGSPPELTPEQLEALRDIRNDGLMRGDRRGLPWPNPEALALDDLPELRAALDERAPHSAVVDQARLAIMRGALSLDVGLAALVRGLDNQAQGLMQLLGKAVDGSLGVSPLEDPARTAESLIDSVKKAAEADNKTPQASCRSERSSRQERRARLGRTRRKNKKLKKRLARAKARRS